MHLRQIILLTIHKCSELKFDAKIALFERNVFNNLYEKIYICAFKKNHQSQF
jgi:hypothetical protein